MTEAEYVSAGKACQQALWMKQALIDYDIRLDDVLVMYDNKGAIDLSKNPMQHSRTKHFEIHHHFLRDNVQKGNISIEKVSFEDNIADILTKPLKRESFNYLRLGLGMMEHIPKAHLLEDKQIPSVGVFDEVFSTWMAFGENTHDLGSFGEETDKITDLHQFHEEILFSERGDGVTGINRCRRDPSSDGFKDLVMASGHGRLNEDLESST
ncbi:hypothetical protein Tco_0781907 [Tanacetum coccineum]